MKSSPEKIHPNKTVLWLLLFSFMGLVIVVSVQTLVGSGNDDLNHIQTLGQPDVVDVPEVTEVLDSTVNQKNGDKTVSDQENQAGSENKLGKKKDATDKNMTELAVDPVDRTKNEKPARKTVTTADRIPDYQTIAQLISANTEGRKRRVEAFIEDKKRSAAAQKTLINHKYMELDQTSAGEKRDNLLKAQEQRQLELVATQKLLQSREALLNRLNHKAVEYSHTQF
jgi:hypothetical protein